LGVGAPLAVRGADRHAVARGGQRQVGSQQALCLKTVVVSQNYVQASPSWAGLAGPPPGWGG
jgi:hypothetical protein